MFEKKRIKAAMGGVISVTTLASGMFLLPGDQSVIASVDIQPFDKTVVLETKKTLVNVLPENTGVSQEYHLGHPGMDITAHLGTKIYPLKEGVVIQLSISKWNYGRSIVIDHGSGLQTRYAHMGKIFVEEGERVTTDQAIGEVGLTGRTTGPHLHIEVLKNGKAINPRTYLDLGKQNLANK